MGTFRKFVRTCLPILESEQNIDHFENPSFILTTYSKLRHVDLSLLNRDIIICDEAHNAIASSI